MVLPIFALVLALILHTFYTSQKTISTSFYIEAVLVLLFSIYFIFYLIYKGFDTKITDNISKTFTREYIYNYLKEEIKNSREYTLLLISVDNLYEINKRYGIKYGDKVLFEVVLWIAEYLKTKEIINFPIGRIKGGDFIIGFSGDKEQYKTIIELMCLKSEEFKVDDIEIQISAALNDIRFSKNIDYLIENLFELQNSNKNSKYLTPIQEIIDPSDLEYFVIQAIKKRDITFFIQEVFEDEKATLKECFIKLNTTEQKILHQKDYMKILDKLRLMHEYDIIVLEEVIEICKKSKDEKFALSIAPTSIRNPVVLTKIKELFQKNECVKGRIILLFSENEYFPKIEKFNSYLKQLKELGITIAVDRLGSIHTSFLYLRDLDIDMVRFDSFYSKKMDKNRYKNILSGFNTMAHEKGMKTWAKMIEDEESRELFKDVGVNYLQGRFLAPLEKIKE
ncbi:MAG: GGDEF domain-containing protein [Sulfurimonas sp.]|uniref:bifunctional diguanylate cyclase/phosphodiesterase n=1 Tax=Sulfurimonas sp. TaxID=2022749 RepID=UPI00260B8948|nr:GGDEF domain-containing protein [Sulfurimonas sp.]MDD2651984.1 GGDEF domain-containing protein [Sulfurimonas sp.]MDD3451890.1 GGDEF domain-containing protein [Sulfurimonas sp.]